MDKELLELCKDVYKQTGWEGNKTLASDTEGDEELFVVSNDFHELGHDARRVAYLYDTDYLLEKLPKLLDIDQKTFSVSVQSQVAPPDFTALYTHTSVVGGKLVSHSARYINVASTPLKALLKLTLALDDADELKQP